MSPYYRNVVANLRDYQTRFYRLVFNTTFTHVTQFTMTSAAWPMTYPGGAVFNYSSNKPINEGYDQYTMQWSAMHCWHNDPLVIREFNRTVLRFNPLMAANTRTTHYKEVPPGYIKYFNYYGYPYIDPDTLEFQLWVKKERYIEILLSVGIAPDISLEDICKDTTGDIFWK